MARPEQADKSIQFFNEYGKSPALLMINHPFFGKYIPNGDEYEQAFQVGCYRKKALQAAE